MAEFPKQFTLAMTHELFGALVAAAKHGGTSSGALLREALVEYLVARGLPTSVETNLRGEPLDASVDGETTAEHAGAGSAPISGDNEETPSRDDVALAKEKERRSWVRAYLRRQRGEHEQERR